MHRFPQLKPALDLVSFPCKNPTARSFSLCLYFWWLPPTIDSCSSSLCSSLTRFNAAVPTGAWKEQPPPPFFSFFFFFWPRPNSFTQAERLSALTGFCFLREHFASVRCFPAEWVSHSIQRSRVHFAHLPFVLPKPLGLIEGGGIDKSKAFCHKKKLRGRWKAICVIPQAVSLWKWRSGRVCITRWLWIFLYALPCAICSSIWIKD